MGTRDDEVFGVEYSESSLFDMCLEVARKLQDFYVSGNTSKRPYGMKLETFVQKVIDGDGINKPTLSFSDFVKLYNELINVPSKQRKGQMLMNLLNKIWSDEYVRISSFDYYKQTDIDCFYKDELIPNTLKHLRKVWEK